MSPPIVLLMAAAGGLGAVARFVVDAVIRSRLRTELPLGTILVNLAGSLLLGLITGLVVTGGDDRLALVAGTGFCGGFTTFSTASVEIVRLSRARKARHALVALGLNALGCMALAWAGLLLTR
ncbi:CrcB family protein [uncultured Propionibacterium sp.]|uniref:fluoride efflux transporter FluC n=1 Tax=uncultured Propionibacterium sp. TaxID=218066 RepID=UPI0029316D0E|nr:CrcB family protein [uncultured Propionibacterium sp.]